MPKKSAALLSVRELENFKMTSVMGQFLCQCFLSFCCLPIFLVADVTLPILTFVRDQPDYELSAALPRIGGRPNKCFARLLNVRDRSLAMLSIVQVQGAFFYFLWSEGFANGGDVCFGMYFRWVGQIARSSTWFLHLWLSVP